MELETIPYDKLKAIYQKLFTLNYLNEKSEKKLGAIALTMFLTNKLQQKKPNTTAYDLLLALCKDYPPEVKNGFLKSFAVLCDDLMYGCSEFTTFGINPKECPKALRKILDTYIPF